MPGVPGVEIGELTLPLETLLSSLGGRSSGGSGRPDIGLAETGVPPGRLRTSRGGTYSEDDTVLPCKPPGFCNRLLLSSGAA